MHPVESLRGKPLSEAASCLAMQIQTASEEIKNAETFSNRPMSPAEIEQLRCSLTTLQNVRQNVRYLLGVASLRLGAAEKGIMLKLMDGA